MAKRLTFTEQRSVQGPLVAHAVGAGWLELAHDEALTLRGGDERELFLVAILRAHLVRLNPWMSESVVDGVVARLGAAKRTIEGNEELHTWLRGDMTAFDPVQKRERDVRLVDFEDPSANALHVTQEWTQESADGIRNRADVLFCVNGVPIVLVECKAAHKKDAIDEGLGQVRRYHRETPEIVLAAQLFEVTHLLDFYYGVTWNPTRRALVNWKDDEPGSFEAKVVRFFDPIRLLAAVRDDIVFLRREEGIQKVVQRQHQTRAIDKAIRRAIDPSKKRGLIWHTQGSGKTLTMIAVAVRLLTRVPGDKPLVLMLIDRNELEGQLIANLTAHGLDTVEIAESKAHLRKLLRSGYRGLVVSMVHKFEGIEADVDLGDDVVVLIDEAHRSVGGDFGNYLFGALPNATVIGFTGTPIDKTAHGRGTFKTFGVDDDEGYLDKYSIAESIEDGTTLRLNYALAPNAMLVPEQQLEEEFLALAEAEGVSDVEELNRVLDRAVNLKAFLKADDRVDQVAKFVAEHFVGHVRPLGYKAFLVGVDREACVLLKAALDRHFPPDRSRVVITSAHNDAEQLKAHHLEEAEERAVRKAFLDPGSELEILIVTEKLLTGFDAPLLYTMYLDKPMRDHALLQAIARVNRPYESEDGVTKPCGFVVDFVGIFDRLERALAFDSEVVDAVITHLDVLKERFAAAMGEAQQFLDLLEGEADDKLLEKLLNHFADPDERASFDELFDEVERLYEIISPDAFLRPYADDFGTLAQIAALLSNAYGTRTMLVKELARKTEELVRSRLGVDGFDGLLAVQQITPETIKRLGEEGNDDPATVVNLVKSLSSAAAGSAQPALMSIDTRAQDILARFADRQVDTMAALDELAAMMEELLAFKRLQEELGLDDRRFAIHWTLQEAGLDADVLRDAVIAAAHELPEHRDHPEQRRELRLRLYGLLLDALPEERIGALIDDLLDARL
jgi:type I restriction enzyme, R subunit